MPTTLQRIWKEDEGVLSFEWILLVTLLAIGIVSGLAGARDAVTSELADIAEAAICLDQSYTLEGVDLDMDMMDDVPESSYTDTKPAFSVTRP